MDRASVTTDNGYRTTVTTTSHRWHADMSIEAGGTDTGPNPEEMLLGALGSCTVITLHMYANRKKWDLQKVDIELEFEKIKAKDYPNYEGDAKFVHLVRQKLRFHGDLNEEQHARLMEIAGKCPVHRILDGPTYTSETELLDDE